LDQYQKTSFDEKWVSEPQIHYEKLSSYKGGVDISPKLIYEIGFKKNKLYLARDFTGAKPLYLLKNVDGIFFSSEAWFQYSISNKLIDLEIIDGISSLPC
jgi:hypothetical protein